MAAEVPAALLWGVRRYLAAANASIISVQRQPFQGGLSGSTLEYWRLSLRRAGVQAALALVYKRGAVVTGAFLAGAPQREALAYAHLPGKVPIDLPTVIAFDLAAGDLWFLPFPPVKYTSHWLANWDEADISNALSDLVRLHLAFWDASSELESWPWLSRPVGTDAPALLVDGLAGLDALLAGAAYDEHLTAKRLGRLHSLASAPAELLATLNDSPMTLLHGDAGFQNIAVSQDGRQRLWYDWQLAAAGPPVLDLVTFLHPWAYAEASSPLPPEAMVDHYIQALARRGRVIDADRFRRQLDAAFLWRWLIQWAPLLGLHHQRLRPEVRDRLYHAFARLHWPALDRWFGV